MDCLGLAVESGLEIMLNMHSTVAWWWFGAEGLKYDDRKDALEEMCNEMVDKNDA